LGRNDLVSAPLGHERDSGIRDEILIHDCVPAVTLSVAPA
jgi:hypothetical protein